ncbi:MAG: NUDIX hydrolase [Candidatus Thermoplasmatota archaeon]|nr:NUDIX hydrolase [Candidatus Thermoplasmatota archaeon]
MLFRMAMTGSTPSLTVDGIIFKEQTILLVMRRHEPFQGKWALPGGFVEYGETTEDAVIREVYEETGLKTDIIELLDVYSDPHRDPRGHTVSIAYMLSICGGALRSGDDASDAQFFNVSQLPELSFDHKQIVQDALRRKR